MGINVSSTFTNISGLFDVGVWKVHSASHKLTNQPVSLWVLDQAALKTMLPSSKDRKRYIQQCAQSFQVMHKIAHRNILRVYEMVTGSRQFAFSSEPVYRPISDSKSYSEDERLYISVQLTKAMVDLHSKNVSLMALCPESLVIQQDMTLKICCFAYMGHPVTAEFVSPKDYVFCVAPEYLPPEYQDKRVVPRTADVYMYAKVCQAVMTGSGDVEMDEQFSDLFERCLIPSPILRPSFIAILSDVAFDLPMARTFEELSELDARKPASLYKYFTRIGDLLSSVSVQMQRNMLLPLFVKYVNQDTRYGVPLIPLIMWISKDFSSVELVSNVLEPLRDALTVMNPVRYGLLVLNCLEPISQRISENECVEFLQPIIIAAMSSDDELIPCEGVRVFRRLLEIIDVGCLKSQLLPAICERMAKARNPKSAAACIDFCRVCLPKVGAEFISNNAIPVIQKIWQENYWTTIANPIADLIYAFESEIDMELKVCSALALEVLSFPAVDRVVQVRLIDFVSNSIERVKSERKFTQAEIKSLRDEADARATIRVDSLKECKEFWIEEEDTNEGIPLKRECKNPSHDTIFEKKKPVVQFAHHRNTSFDRVAGTRLSDVGNSRRQSLGGGLLLAETRGKPPLPGNRADRAYGLDSDMRLNSIGPIAGQDTALTEGDFEFASDVEKETDM